jgi:hypothetical protein
MSHFDWPILPPPKNPKKKKKKNKFLKQEKHVQLVVWLALDANTIENLVGTHGEH